MNRGRSIEKVIRNAVVEREKNVIIWKVTSSCELQWFGNYWTMTTRKNGRKPVFCSWSFCFCLPWKGKKETNKRNIIEPKFVLAMQLSTFNIFISDVRFCVKFEFGRIWNCSLAFRVAAVRRKSESCDFFFVCARSFFFSSLLISPHRKKRSNRKSNFMRNKLPETMKMYNIVWSHRI